MKLEIELSDKLYNDMRRAAKNLRITPRRFVLRAIRRLADSNQISGEEITASLNKFFEENPDLTSIEAQRYWKN